MKTNVVEYKPGEFKVETDEGTFYSDEDYDNFMADGPIWAGGD
jgi:hypothetical protein